jgi:archaellum component FlaC
LSEDKPNPSLSTTQELKPPTVADVLEVFQRFQDSILDRIDQRDRSVLVNIQKIVSDVAAQYQRQTERSDDHERRIKSLETKYHELANDVATMKLKSEREAVAADSPRRPPLPR